MMKKEKTLRMAVTGALLLTVVAAGISMYRTDTTPKKESKAQQEEESNKFLNFHCSFSFRRLIWVGIHMYKSGIVWIHPALYRR